MKNDMKLLEGLGEIAEKMQPKPDSYWIEEEEFLKKRMAENRRVAESIKMSDEKYHQRFTI